MAALVFEEKLFGYDVIGKLGRGSSSIVYDVRDENGEEMALKVPENKDYKADGHLNLVELTIMCGMEHPNLLRGKLCISPSGSIGILMKKIDKTVLQATMSYVDCLSAVYQVGMALLFLHNNGYGHFDIKPDNILYDTKTGKAYLIDFSISSLLDKDGRCKKPESITLTYRPPENMEQGIDGLSTYGKDSDVWSLAMTMVHMLGRGKFYLSRFRDQKEYKALLESNLTEGKCEAFILSLLPVKLHPTPLATFVITLLKGVFLPRRENRISLHTFLSDPLFCLHKTRECYEFDLTRYDPSIVGQLIASSEKKLCGALLLPSPHAPSLPTLCIPKPVFPAVYVVSVSTLPMMFTMPLLSVGRVKGISVGEAKTSFPWPRSAEETPFPMQQFIKLAIAVYGTQPLSVLFLGIDIAYRTLSLNTEFYTHASACLFLAFKCATGFTMDVNDVTPGDTNSASIIKMENEIVKTLGGVIYRPYFYSMIENIGQITAVLEMIVPYPDKYCNIDSLRELKVSEDLRPKELMCISDISL